MELKLHGSSLKCVHCNKSGQFVSHGYVYKKAHDNAKKIIGKRIFCSNRFKKSGCGCTQQFYLAAEVPAHQYNTKHVAAFVDNLFKGCSIEKSYAAATNTTEPRNAYRWLKKMEFKCLEYRRAFKLVPQIFSQTIISASKRTQLLFCSLKTLFFDIKPECSTYVQADFNPCEYFQHQQQMAFL